MSPELLCLRAIQKVQCLPCSPPSPWYWFLVTFAARGGVFCVCCGLVRLCYLARMFGGCGVWCTRMHALCVVVFGRSVGWSWCLPFLHSFTLSRFPVSVRVLATLVSVCFVGSFFCTSYLFLWLVSFFSLYLLTYVICLCYVFLTCYVSLYVLFVSGIFCCCLSCVHFFLSSFFSSVGLWFSLSLSFFFSLSVSFCLSICLL